MDTSGIHSVNLDYCNCTGLAHLTEQLLRARLYPATVAHPRTAATFDVLKTFQLLSFMSKVSAYEYYHTLARLTDNTGTVEVPVRSHYSCQSDKEMYLYLLQDRYRAFLRMVREWRHIRLLKRRGRGHDPTGVKGTKEGELAVLCPACPYPDINLPPGWENAPPLIRYVRSNYSFVTYKSLTTLFSWLYTLFVAMDANFRLKRLLVSSELRDPGLNHGFAYVVEEVKFKAHLLEYGKKIVDDISTCNNHDALKSASKRGGKGISSSGAGTIECSRHDMKRALAVGDLQKGER